MELLRKRAVNQFHALTSRVGPKCHRMDKHLGTSAWNEFKRYTKQHYQCGFIARFLPTSTCATIACAGPIYDSSGCPHNHIVNLENFVPNVDELGLADLHLDHEIELLQVCDIWRKLTPSNPNTWHENIDPTKLCELIFGVQAHSHVVDPSFQSNLVFRCARWSRSHPKCHQFSRRHHMHNLREEDFLASNKESDGVGTKPW